MFNILADPGKRGFELRGAGNRTDLPERIRAGMEESPGKSSVSADDIGYLEEELPASIKNNGNFVQKGACENPKKSSNN